MHLRLRSFEWTVVEWRRLDQSTVVITADWCIRRIWADAYLSKRRSFELIQMQLHKEKPDCCVENEYAIHLHKVICLQVGPLRRELLSYIEKTLYLRCVKYEIDIFVWTRHGFPPHTFENIDIQQSGSQEGCGRCTFVRCGCCVGLRIYQNWVNRVSVRLFSCAMNNFVHTMDA